MNNRLKRATAAQAHHVIGTDDVLNPVPGETLSTCLEAVGNMQTSDYI